MEIIGGPAIRRTQPDAVYIWLVLDTNPSQITITVSTNQNLSTPVARSQSEPDNIVKVGENLFICLVKVTADNGTFLNDIKFYYDISINDQTLSDFGLLAGDNSIVYGADTLPSFFIPTKHSNILHGSCRKPHAANKSYHSQFDHMRTADNLLNTAIDKLDSRPSMLCLTGDQIYADDVALPLLCALKDEAKRYIGWTEELPHAKDNRKTVIPDAINLCGRNSILTKTIGFTSGNKDNHLMTFGEYMMMYLVVWGGLSVNMPAYSAIANDIVRLTKKRHRHTYKLPKLSYDDYEEQRAILMTFLRNARKSRRIMANLPTYMMFDDHEVSDDWNLTEKNHTLFKTNPLSKRIQANALAAYWACQAWGNNPDGFANDFKTSVSKFLCSKSVRHGATFEASIRKQYWNYTVEGYPVLVALDTRTRRDFKDSKFSQLMSEKEINKLKNEFIRINTLYKTEVNEQSVLLLSPAPFLGFTAMERLQLAVDFLPNTVDGEPWIGSEIAYDNMKKALSRLDFKQCCIISGDVHYAFSRCMHLPRANKPDLEVLQITCSSLHNSPSGVMRQMLDLLTTKERSVFNREKTPYLYPTNISEFLNGHTNISHIQYSSGQAIKNSYVFFDPNKGKKYKWNYNLKNYQTVNLT